MLAWFPVGYVGTSHDGLDPLHGWDPVSGGSKQEVLEFKRRKYDRGGWRAALEIT